MKNILSIIGGAAIVVALLYFAVIMPVKSYNELEQKNDRLTAENKQLTEQISQMDDMYQEIINSIPEDTRRNLERRGLYNRDSKVSSLSSLTANY